MISVIVPVYNVEKYLKQCLESLINQTYKDYEIIAINDGSTDESLSIIKSFQVSNSKILLINKENEGLGKARNDGIKKASGSYICFVDSDDWVSSSFLSDFAKFFNEDPDVIISKNYIFDSMLGYVITSRYKDYGMDYFFEGAQKELQIECKLLGRSNLISQPFLVQDDIVCVWKNCYKASLLQSMDRYFLSEREVMLEDFNFNIRVYHKAKKIVVSNSRNYYYRVVQGSLSKKYRENYVEKIERLFNDCRDYVLQNTYYRYDVYEKCFQNFFMMQLVIILYNNYRNPKGNPYYDTVTLLNSPFFEECRKYGVDETLPMYYRLFCKLIMKKRNKVLHFLFLLLRKHYRLYRIIRLKIDKL